MQFTRDPPPYPGHSKQLAQPAGFRQSYSGSETSGTDLSMSSNENIALTTRQDPQGEEQLHGGDYHYSITLDDNSILARLGLPAVEMKSSTNGPMYVTGNMPARKDQPFSYDYPDKPYYPDNPQPPPDKQQQLLYYSSAGMQILNNNVDLTGLPPPPEYPGNSHSNKLSNGPSQGTVALSNHGDGSHGSVNSSSSELSADGQKRSLCRSYEVISSGACQTARSQPDLSRFSDLKLVNIMDAHPAQLAQDQQRMLQHHHQQQQQQQQLFSNHAPPRRSSPGTPPHEMPRPLADKDLSTLPPIQPKPKRDVAPSGRDVTSSGRDVTSSGRDITSSGREMTGVDAAMASRALQMVEMLSEENKALRNELNSYHKKIGKLQQFETEIQKVHEAHEALIRSSEKRESLERTMRLKLQAEVQKLRDQNKEFSERLEKTLSDLTRGQAPSDSPDVRLEISKKDAIIAKLVAQNRDMSARHDQMEGDLQLQQATIQEQRAHIDVLDNALSNAQTNVIRSEEELFRRESESGRLDQLQRTLEQIQITADKREQIHQQLKRNYQLDLQTLRAQLEGSPVTVGACSEGEVSCTPAIRERDARILELEAEKAQWEQRYLQESALRELAVEAASQPKEARILALEANSAATERRMEEARSERMRHLEEVYLANKRAGDMEAKVKTLQAQLAEKEALVRVFQKHSFSSSSLFSPTHSPLPSTIHAIQTSHSHNHLTNSQSVTASYTGFHARTDSSSDCPPYSKPNAADASRSTAVTLLHHAPSTLAYTLPNSVHCTTVTSVPTSVPRSLSNSAGSLGSLSGSAGSVGGSAGNVSNMGGVSNACNVSAPAAGAVTTQADKKPSQSTKQSLLQFLAHKRLHQSETGSRSRSSSQSSTSSASGLWQV